MPTDYRSKITTNKRNGILKQEKISLSDFFVRIEDKLIYSIINHNSQNRASIHSNWSYHVFFLWILFSPKSPWIIIGIELLYDL